jgi:pantetheine-phosphate adenylyltransferase
MNRAVFPGSFDPITKGHVSVITRGLKIFDEIIVAIGVNSTKNHMFSVEQRKAWILAVFADFPNVKVDIYEGLTIDYCKSVQANFILRGLRTSADFEFERSIGQVNKMMDSNIETIFLLTDRAHTPITSSIVRDIIRNGGNISPFVPEEIEIH